MNLCADCQTKLFDDSRDPKLRSWFDCGSILLDLPEATVCFDCYNKRSARVSEATGVLNRAGVVLDFSTPAKALQGRLTYLMLTEGVECGSCGNMTDRWRFVDGIRVCPACADRCLSARLAFLLDCDTDAEADQVYEHWGVSLTGNERMREA